jgi:hypothetical protein
MENSPSFLEKAAVGHLVGEGMLEGIHMFWEEARLV